MEARDRMVPGCGVAACGGDPSKDETVSLNYTDEEIRAAGERVTNALRAEQGLPPIVIPPRDPREIAVRPFVQQKPGRALA